MTEQEWLACNDSRMLSAFLRGEASDRQLRLFACACSRRVWHLLKSENDRKAVEVAERHADAQVDVSELVDAACKAGGSQWGEPSAVARFTAFQSAPQAARLVVRHLADIAPDGDIGYVGPALLLVAPALRDIVRNPFRKPSISTACRTPGVATLAQAAYEGRHLPSGHLDPARLRVLSDALEEAGCTDAELLTHLRTPGPHVRGCWALDLILSHYS